MGEPRTSMAGAVSQERGALLSGAIEAYPAGIIVVWIRCDTHHGKDQ